MSIEKYKITINPANQLTKGLEVITEGSLLTSLFKSLKLKKEVAELGLLFLHRKHEGYYDDHISLGSKEAEKFKTLLRPNIWEDQNYYSLLIYFFGEQKAPYVKYAWNLMPFKMYQSSYLRRSFRAPEHEHFVLLNQVNFLRSALKYPTAYDSRDGWIHYDGMNMEEEIIHANELSFGSYQFMIWSAAIDLGNTKIYQLAEDIIFNKHPEGKVSRNLIKALLNSERKECWELVEKLLLAAQRQEGLRQTILEALDETSIGALQYMIKVIADHKLSRFSSVIRAIDTWTGLGWEAEKETTIRSIIELSDQYFSDPELIKTGILSKNNHEVYMALWVQGVLNVEKTVPHLHSLIEKGSLEKQSLALKFAGETGDPYIEMPLYLKAINNGNLQLLAFALPRMEALLMANVDSKYYINHPDCQDLFDKIYRLSQSIEKKDQIFEGKVFSWLSAKFEKDSLFACLIYLVGDNDERLQIVLQHFDTLAIKLRETLTKSILKDYYAYSYALGMRNAVEAPPTAFQRSFALKILKDRGETMVASAINVLDTIDLQPDELGIFSEMLKRKNTTLRKKLLEVLLKQQDQTLIPFIDHMHFEGDAEQRMAALELMMRLQKEKRISKNIEQWIASYEKNKKSEKEQALLEQLLPENKTTALSEANGYGLYRPENISAYTLPIIEENGVYSKLTKNDKYGLSMSKAHVKKELEKLAEIFKKNADYEYESENYNNVKERGVLGNGFKAIRYQDQHFNVIEKFENYPLHEIWDKWFVDSGLTDADLFLLTLAIKPDHKDWQIFLDDHIFYGTELVPDPGNGFYYWNNPYLKILQVLSEKYSFKEATDFLLDATVALYKDLPKHIINYKFNPKSNGYYYSSGRNGDGWQSMQFFDVFLNKVNLMELTDEQIKKAWNIYRWRQFNGLTENIKESMPPIYLYGLAFKNGLITIDEMYEGILYPDRIFTLTEEKKHHKHLGSEKLLSTFDFLPPMLNNIRDSFLAIELKRGDTNTPVTIFVQNFQKIYGINRFVALISGLGKTNLYKGYIYSYSNSDISKQMLFSKLLKCCYPLAEDTHERFDELVKQAKINETKLVQASIYAPQWQKYISNYLGWKGLDSAIWWMHAHTKSSGYQYQNSDAESEIAKYSAVELQDFSDGAVDKTWFESAYKQLGKARWEIIYESAKYITDGNGHRRAKLYADTLLDDLKIREVTAKVKDKRDQDYLRVYGLVPLSKTNPDKDVLARYEYLQQFKKESREFGSMRQSSEALAIRIAMENLARNAGYPDPMRLSWAMETQQIQKILSSNTQIEIDGTTVGLVIEADGKAELVTFKDGKQLKSIPPKIKKNASVIALTGHRKTLREQWTRSRKSLEEAMVRGDEFLHAEVINLLGHPVISKHLQKLVFVSNRQETGFFNGNELINVSGKVISLDDKQTLRIAHCVDLHRSAEWVAYQAYCFDNKLKQPFKQIFRELYIPTTDELAEKSVSRRYSGHQVQPGQTLALLKTRGWKADYEEGLQKVFHKAGFQVKLYAMADWFSPADIESPTLETIEFHDLKDFKNIAFKDISPLIFSEVMRDIDLVVSVAHVGSTDPEASHSSIEMRSVLLNETLRLFKLDNVAIKGSHAFIKGKLGNYSIHLGSAIVHQLPGKYLSVLPVHSQQRGRLFLPFADDDPKSAELLSKVLLFAEDHKIQDPTILSQIERTNVLQQ